MSNTLRNRFEDYETIREVVADLPTPTLSEVVFRTSRYEEMRDWYSTVLGARPTLDRRQKKKPQLIEGGAVRAGDALSLCFIRIGGDSEDSQVVGIFELPDLDDNLTEKTGLDHVRFSHKNLSALMDRVEPLLSVGFRPYRAANHGPRSSFYFYDPDGNRVELSASNFDTLQEEIDYMASEKFKKRPSGIDVDPDEYIRRFRSGISQEEFIQIPD